MSRTPGTYAIFDTTEGMIEVALDTKKTPNTVNNFIVLSRYKYYDGSYIFRTDPSIDIIQGGGASNSDDPGYSIKDEANGFKYAEGDLVMARTAAPDSAGGQFFFVTGEKAALLATVERLVTERIPRRFGFDPVTGIQVLTPMHRGLLGAAGQVVQPQVAGGDGAVAVGDADQAQQPAKCLGVAAVGVRIQPQRQHVDGQEQQHDHRAGAHHRPRTGRPHSPRFASP